MRVYHCIEGTIAARLSRALGPRLAGATRLDCLIIFSIRGDERLPLSLDALVGSLTGQRAAFAVIGDYSRAPDASHPVAHGLREWAEPEHEGWVAWVDAPIPDEDSQLRRLADWAGYSAGAARIVPQRLPLRDSDVLASLLARLSDSPRIDLSDYARYDRSLWRGLADTEVEIFAAALADDDRLEGLNLGWVEFDAPSLPLPANLRLFRARGLTSVNGWLQNGPALHEIVLVGGGLSQVEIPGRTISTLRRVILDKNSLAALPPGLQWAPIEILSLYRNNFNEVPATIRKMPFLESLTIGANPITNLPCWLAELPSLKAIDISNLQLDQASSGVVCALRERGINVRTRKASAGGLSLSIPQFEQEFPRLPSFR